MSIDDEEADTHRLSAARTITKQSKIVGNGSPNRFYDVHPQTFADPVLIKGQYYQNTNIDQSPTKRVVVSRESSPILLRRQFMQPPTQCLT